MSDFIKTEPITIKFLSEKEREDIIRGLKDGTLVPDDDLLESEEEYYELEDQKISYNNYSKKANIINTSEKDFYLKNIIKNIVFLLAFWIGYYWVITGTYKEVNEWTFEQIFTSIGATTFLALVVAIFLFIRSTGTGIIISIIFTIICLFILAYLGDKATAALHMSNDASWQALTIIMSISGIIINVNAIVKLIRNIHYYRLLR